MFARLLLYGEAWQMFQVFLGGVYGQGQMRDHSSLLVDNGRPCPSLASRLVPYLRPVIFTTRCEAQRKWPVSAIVTAADVALGVAFNSTTQRTSIAFRGHHS